jgi:hypothetical protein
MSPVRCIVITATLAGVIAGCGGQSEYVYSSPRYTPGYTPSGKSYTSQSRDDRNDNGIHPGPERRPFA